MWRERIRALFSDAKFSDPATDDRIRQIERELGVALPDELRAALRESDGVRANYGAPLVWPASEILAQNREFRANPDFTDLYMPFDDLLFFGGDGGGDQFAYRILGGRILETSWIYKWSHDDDSREWFASDLHDFFRRCIPASE